MAYDELMRRAVDFADPNILRLAILQATGDEALADMATETVPIRAGLTYVNALRQEHHGVVRDRARAYLASPRQPDRVAAEPAEPRVRELVEAFTGEAWTDQRSLRFVAEELALPDIPRDVRWRHGQPPPRVKDYHVAVIGAGISGIAAGVILGRLGIPYTIYERQDDLGGTWQLNTYPGARVDVACFMYQFTFEKTYRWKHIFPLQAETLEYLRYVARKHDVLQHIVFDTEVVEAEWDEQSSRWSLLLKDGQEPQATRVWANTVFSASGLFSTPRMPEIEGMDDYLGGLFHTARWDHAEDVAGKRIAIIGNGSSGAQLMPTLAAEAAAVTVYVRTPVWILEMENYHGEIEPELQWLFDNVPYYRNWHRFNRFLTSYRTEGLQVYDADHIKAGGQINARNDAVRANATEYIRRKVNGDPDLMSKLIPSFAPYARRHVVDNGWYDALMRDNVDLVTDQIARFSRSGIVTVDGDERSHDVVICATGFDVFRYFWPVVYRGVGGATLEESWRKDGPRSYLGISLPGFPNFFAFYGPNGAPRSGSFYSWAEIWAKYAAQAVVYMIENNVASVDLKRDVYDRYNEDLDAETQKIIWEREAVGSYYVNAFGRSGLNMPWNGGVLHDWLSRFNPDLYHQYRR